MKNINRNKEKEKEIFNVSFPSVTILFTILLLFKLTIIPQMSGWGVFSPIGIPFALIFLFLFLMLFIAILSAFLNN